MKNNYLLLFLFAFISGKLVSQTVVSSCTATANVTQLYATDAQRLADRRVFADSSSFRDSALIPNVWTDTSLRALIAVYNATSLPARDSVAILYPVHTFGLNPNLRDLIIDADSALPWMQQLKLGHLNTGNAQVDSLIALGHFQIGHYTSYSFTYYHEVIFNADTNFNLQAISKKFLAVPGVVYAYPNPGAGDGTDIIDSVTSTFVQLRYILKWGDCESGCINWHSWLFRVFYDCSVQYFGSSGDSIAVAPVFTGIEDTKGDIDFLVYPNPANHRFAIRVNENCEGTVTNALGQKVWQKKIEAGTDVDVEMRNAGLYLVMVKTSKGLETRSVVVY
ncbi:MAG: hypothetical protein JWO06_1439 [Bacteroidota bacterium]|nr:hypothetical protein [Bacteroidota bacterium]